MPIEQAQYAIGTWTWSDILGALIGIVVLILLWSLAGYPKWRVWAAHQAGLADLQRAKNDQQVQVAAAQGRLDAAQLNKQSAIIEAQAVSCQIKEIGQELRSHDLYLRWQWIKMMEESGADNTVVYVPTEANLPILEAQRFGPGKNTNGQGEG